MSAISAKTARITIFAKNWRNRPVNENMSKRAPTRSAISAKTAKTARITIFAKNWKNRRVDVNMSNRAPTRSAIFVKTAKTARIAILGPKRNCGIHLYDKSCHTQYKVESFYGTVTMHSC